MVNQKIVSYVKSCMNAGWSLSRIRSDLYNAGWQKKDIEEAITSVASKPVTAARPENIPNPGSADKMQMDVKPGRKKFYISVIILIAVIGIGTYFIVSYILSSNIPVTPPAEPAQAVCGDGNCTGQETYEICPADCPAPPTNQNVKLNINPASRTVNSGESVNFDVEITSVSNLYGFQFDLEFNPNQLSFSKATEGTFLSKNGADQTFCIPPKTSTGTSSITIACTRLGAIGGIEGDGILESVTFTALTSGAAEVKLTNIKLVDSSAKRISVSG